MTVCQVYRSPRRAEMYLYVEMSAGLERVPPALLHQFGEPEPVLIVKLDGKRQLARVDAQAVEDAVREQGYYLQMPPVPGAVDSESP